LDFINENPTIFHAVDYFCKKLEKEGFLSLSERDIWNQKLKPGGRYYVKRNDSSLVAFSIPADYKPGNGVGAPRHSITFTHPLNAISRLHPSQL